MVAFFEKVKISFHRLPAFTDCGRSKFRFCEFKLHAQVVNVTDGECK